MCLFWVFFAVLTGNSVCIAGLKQRAEWAGWGVGGASGGDRSGRNGEATTENGRRINQIPARIPPRF